MQPVSHLVSRFWWPYFEPLIVFSSVSVDSSQFNEWNSNQWHLLRCYHKQQLNHPNFNF